MSHSDPKESQPACRTIQRAGSLHERDRQLPAAHPAEGFDRESLVALASAASVRARSPRPGVTQPSSNPLRVMMPATFLRYEGSRELERSSMGKTSASPKGKRPA